MGRGGKREGAGNKKGERLITQQMRMDIIEALKTKGFEPCARMLWLYDEAKRLYDEAQAGYWNANETKKIINPWLVNSRWMMMQSVSQELMEYVYPKRKAIELTGADGQNLFVSFAQAMKEVHDMIQKESAIPVESNPVE